MAVKQKAKKLAQAGGLDPVIEQGVIDAVKSLLQTHGESIKEMITDSENKKAVVTLKCDFDESESETRVDVTIRYSTSTTDKRTVTRDDPQQPFLILTPEQLQEREDAAAEAQGDAPEDKDNG